jgi:hypothetical protein
MVTLIASGARNRANLRHSDDLLEPWRVCRLNVMGGYGLLRGNLFSFVCV